jgi:hypothetical protein
LLSTVKIPSGMQSSSSFCITFFKVPGELQNAIAISLYIAFCNLMPAEEVVWCSPVYPDYVP